jgi:hypothetical protein
MKARVANTYFGAECFISIDILDFDMIWDCEQRLASRLWPVNCTGVQNSCYIRAELFGKVRRILHIKAKYGSRLL